MLQSSFFPYSHNLDTLLSPSFTRKRGIKFSPSHPPVSSSRAKPLLHLTRGREAVTRVAYSLSDLLFIYPLSSSNYLGEGATQWKNYRNCFSNPVKVKELSTRCGAGNAIYGALSKGEMVSALLPSHAIPEMLPTLHRISSSPQPAVFHVSTFSVASDLSISPDQSELFLAKDARLIFLASSSPSETQDMAICAHLAALRTRFPSLHVFDGSRVGEEKTKLSTLNPGALFNAVKGWEKGERAAWSDIPIIVDNVMEEMTELVGKRYHPFDYYGHERPEHVLIAMGGSVPTIRATVEELNRMGYKIGVVVVRLFRPFSVVHFLSTLPSNVRSVSVVEETSGRRALYFDVFASLKSPSASKFHHVEIISVRTNGQELNPGVVKSLFDNGLNQEEKELDLTLTEETISKETVDVIPAKIKQAILWETSSSTLSTDLEETIGERTSLSLRSFTSHNPYVPIEGDLKRVELSFSSVSIPSLPISQAHTILCTDPSLLSHCEALKEIQEGGIFLLDAPWNEPEATEKIPSHISRAIVQNWVQCILYDGEKVEKDLGVSRRTISLLAFFCLSGLVNLGKWDGFLNTFIMDHEPSLGDLPAGETPASFIIKAIERTKVEVKFDGLVEKEKWRKVMYRGAVKWMEMGSGEIFDQRTDILGDDEEISFPAFKSYLSMPEVEMGNEGSEATESGVHQLAWRLMFPESYGTKSGTRPRAKEKTYLAHLTKNVRLTPTKYHRNIFHMEIDTTGTALKYAIGEALGVYGHNDAVAVKKFLDWYGLDPSTVLALPGREGEELRTVEQLFTQVVDIFGRPNRRFYESLLPFVTNDQEKQEIEHLISPQGKDAFKVLVEESVSYADILVRFPSAHPSLADLLNLIPPIKPRHYSIASSQNMHPNSVHLLVVLVGWENSKGEKKFGQCTRYLSDLKAGDPMTVSIVHSVLKLPQDMKAPVIMAGLGTGMAPFRAFIEERAYWKEKGEEVGEMVLYFGSRHRAEEYLYGEELEAYHQEGVLTGLRLAFSRDQEHKVYIQNKIEGDLENGLLWDLLQQKVGSFFLCGPTWPVPDVRDALVKGFALGLGEEGDIGKKRGTELLDAMKEEGRYILEVY